MGVTEEPQPTGPRIKTAASTLLAKRDTSRTPTKAVSGLVRPFEGPTDNREVKNRDRLEDLGAISLVAIQKHSTIGASAGPLYERPGIAFCWVRRGNSPCSR